VTAFRSLAVAILKGFVRDRMAVFFSILFPLMFLVLFGGVFANQGVGRIDVEQVGAAPLIEQLPAGARTAFDDAFDVTRIADWDTAVDDVREGDTDLAIRQEGDALVVRFSQADQAKAAVAVGTMQSFVQTANQAATNGPPKYEFDAGRVEDESLKTIQFVTPGLLGWAIATSATFGAAATLVQWRTTKLLRRLRLAPISTSQLVVARIGVTVSIAIGQFALFVGLGVAAFGLKLTGSWWMALPLLVCGTLAFMAMGLFAGSVSKTVEGSTGLANFLVLPMAFLSGSFFPLSDAPTWLDIVSHVLPLRYLNDGMLDVMVRGDGPSAAVLPMGILVAFAAIVVLISSRFFTWETD
jgi:ABC-2 type transport system permease protein